MSLDTNQDNRNIIKNASADIKVAQPIPISHEGVARTVEVIPIKSGEVVKQIEVRCSCGQITKINCHYQ